MRDILIFAVAFAMVCFFPVASADESFTREEVAHAFGTDSDRTHYPQTAVDTDDVPNIVLKASERRDAPLRYYRIAPDTYLFYGNIAEVDENNRGWNGNAGFVVTPDGVVVIDSLGTPKLGERMIATIRRVTDRPIKYLIVTHNHPDHAYGAIAFRRLGGVTVIGHEDMELQEAVDRHDFPEWQRVRLYGLNHRINLSFVYREMEQEMF